MSPRISLLCPTRNRPDNVRRLLSSARDTAAGVVEAVLYCDGDAPGSVPPDVRDMAWVSVLTGPRTTLSDCWNACWLDALTDVFMLCGDDLVFRTPGWDDIVLAELERYPDRIAFVHGRDGLREDDYGTHGFLHRNWTGAVGYFVPPGFSCDFVDTWLNDVANRIGRRVPADILTEHMHPNAGKAPWDQVHQERRQRGLRDGVEALYAAREGERERDAAKLLAAMS